MCVDGCEAHVLQDGGQEDGEGGVADVAAEVHELDDCQLASPKVLFFVIARGKAEGIQR